ncbi:hypothetical protein O7614_16080 [Micromonospora sp. WMMD961]|uniref:hypothetical protein n=1 Tax=Micromonospora sp. WMMD961 TaxID=3016100 RepID=UPI002417B9F3|nr:hypothetical protein [Micromonospora sp. WMMD961]MDG4781168.1 hypothetical protein [Micromonospora sp. WMMD961]
MSQSAPDRRVDDDRATRLARICADVAQVGDLLGPEPAQALTRLRDRSLSEQGVDAVLAEVTELMRVAGLVGGDTTARGDRYLPLPGIHGRRPEVVQVCPADLCDRVEIPRPDAEAPPRCAVWDCPLPAFRMDR